ncbi:hypothetical protein Glove_372g92 [Diversispora epigaea]|uniref:Uncharacterized protein n=1 Tax=Diversispora epigaea TaxID=1348612 RepID=A0A397H695_9GLOM|nr:hypothetical protein Glove_372g92 [Diversispora epigaea]
MGAHMVGLKKAIDLALATNSYDELISMCQDFLNSKQSGTGNEVSVVIDITNPKTKKSLRRSQKETGKAEFACRQANLLKKINEEKKIDEEKKKKRWRGKEFIHFE